MSKPCIQIPALPRPDRLSLPGGVVIEQHELLAVVQPALAPIFPMLQIVDAVLATFRCLQAIPEALGPPPDPSVLTSRLGELAQKADKLLRLVPQLSLPLTVLGVVDLLLGALTDAQRQLLALQRQARHVDEAAARAQALGDSGLLDVVACAKRNHDQEVGNVGASLAALGKLVALLNLLGGMVGAPRVPELGNAAGLALEPMLEVISSLRDTLAALRDILPGR